MNIFVGNLLFEATEADVRKLFKGFGNVDSVTIVMEKEKKAPKSRGFGFVQMPDEQQALAAIAALNGKEFMGRALNVNPARPKPVVAQDKGETKKIRLGIKVKGQEYHREEGDGKNLWYNPALHKKRGRYKTGRRSQSFMKRRAASGIVEEAMPKRQSRENPLPWRKSYEQPKPRQKSHGKPKPWKKTDGESKLWGKSTGEPKSLKRKEGEFKPWRKKTGGPKPWRKSSKRRRPRQSRIESRRKPGGYTR